MQQPPRAPRLVLPRAPEEPAPFSFPIVATIAPVIVSVAIWLITQSPLALVFAALGPVIAVGSYVDSRFQSRRRRRAESERFSTQLAAARAELLRMHARELAELELRHPTVVAVLSGSVRARALPRWQGSARLPPLVVLGRAAIASEVTVVGDPSEAPEPWGGAVRELAEDAARLRNAPVTVDGSTGIGVAGAEPQLTAAGRAIVCQLAALLSPVAWSLEVEGLLPGSADWDWLDRLPCPVTHSSRPSATILLSFVPRDADIAPVSVALATDRLMLLGTTSVVVLLEAGSAVIERVDSTVSSAVAPNLLSREQAIAWVALLRTEAVREGLEVGGGVPDVVAFAELPESPEAEGLGCAIAMGSTGALFLDLVDDGPHAIVGGTTGSGKSELLISWVLSLARSHPPTAVNVLLIDFKGGSSFGSLTGLPHCVGLLTDLDEHTATRAFDSLAAELRHRERTLAAVGARSIDDLRESHKLPRLVIVVDEFAAMAAGFPELHGLFTDIAARGRSLGVHLILCTQRPAGVIRDAVLANSAIRLSLRVNNRADSMAVIGSDDAALLPAKAKGRALVSLSGEPAVAVQVPLATVADATAVVERWAHLGVVARRPWLDPLPALITPAQVAAHPAYSAAEGIVFGLIDEPAEQRQVPAVYIPVVHGNLLVVGGSGSGRTTMLAALAADAEPIPSSMDDAWDAVTEALATVRTGAAAVRRLLLLDDLDALMARFGEDHRSEFGDRLAALLREGPTVGLRMVITAQRLTGAIQSAVALCGSRLVLGLPNRQEHLLAGAEASQFRPNLPPGAGSWQGHAVQVLFSDPGAEAPRARQASVFRPSGSFAVVAARPREAMTLLREAHPELRIIEIGPGADDPREITVSTGTEIVALLGDPAAWQAYWGALATLRATQPVMVHGCSVAEFRASTGYRELPPPIANTPGAFWVLEPEGGIRRAIL